MSFVAKFTMAYIPQPFIQSVTLVRAWTAATARRFSHHVSLNLGVWQDGVGLYGIVILEVLQFKPAPAVHLVMLRFSFHRRNLNAVLGVHKIDCSHRSSLCEDGRPEDRP